MKTSLSKWLVLALVLRGVRAYTHSTFGHADEWYQTLEWAHLLSHGVATWTQEITLHLRNMTWPMLLALPLSLARWMNPDSLHLKLFLAQLFSGLLDLGMLWAIWEMLRGFSLDARSRNLAMAAFILPWFFVRDSVSMSSEHASTIAFWILLACLSKRRWFASGVLSVAVFALRYPSGLLSFGALLATFVSRAEKRDMRAIGLCVLGIFSGALLFGIPDWVAYGRPWESLWMYLQYNLWSGLGLQVFGSDSPRVYLDFFTERWLTVLAPLAIAAFSLAGYGIWKEHREERSRAWIWAFFTYFLGHLAIAHRESRFMAPLESLVVWAAVIGLMHARAELTHARGLSRAWSGNPVFRDTLFWIFRISILANLFVVFFPGGMLWGETWKSDSEYFRVAALSADHSKLCAILTVRRHSSFLYPQFATNAPVSVPIGHLDMDRNEPSWPVPPSASIAWADQKPECTGDQSVLIQTHRANPAWEDAGCRFERRGAYALFPERVFRKLESKRWISGPWYRCPSSVLEKLPKGHVENPLAREFRRIDPLPAYGTSAAWLLDFMHSDPRSRQCFDLCFADRTRQN